MSTDLLTLIKVELVSQYLLNIFYFSRFYVFRLKFRIFMFYLQKRQRTIFYLSLKYM